MPYSRVFSRQVGFGLLMLNADKDKSGGSNQKTVPELLNELEQATKDKTSAEQSARDLQGKLTSEEGKSKDLQTKLTAEEKKSADLQLKLTAAEGQVAQLKIDNANAQQKGLEAAAAAGVTSNVEKPADASANNGGAKEHEGKKHYDAYQLAMQQAASGEDADGNAGLKAAQIFQEHEKAITAYVATLEKKQS